MVLELTVLRFLWCFNFDYAHYVLAGAIWMLGWCMVLMAGLIRFQPKTIAVVGLGVIFGQALLGRVGSTIPESAGAVRGLLQFLYFGGPVTLGASGPPISVLYSIVPWIGVMAAATPSARSWFGPPRTGGASASGSGFRRPPYSWWWVA